MSYHRITAKEARERLESGKQVIAVPSKMRPDSMFACVVDRVNDFTKWSNEFIYYNCNKETGTVIAFYLAD